MTDRFFYLLAAAAIYAFSGSPLVSSASAGTWTFCANENNECSFTGTRQVQYGANGKYVYKTFNGGTECDNAVFGNPNSGATNICSYSAVLPAPSPSPSPSPWVFCADEGSSCSFTGTRQVRYGANGKYIYKSFNKETECDNGVFGNPNSGATNSCYYSPVVVTPSPTPSPTPTVKPSPSPSPSSAPPVSGNGTTWYIRTDGGTSLQCTGKTNAAYTGGTSVQWQNSIAYTVGQEIVDTNNHLEKVTTAGTSSPKYPPSWNSATGGTTSDTGVVWTNEGPLPSAQNCAYNHPFFLTTTNTTGNALSWVPTSGDVVQFEDYGPYYIGNALPKSLGTYWLACIGNDSACVLPAVPSGVSIFGKNRGSCHTAGHTGLVNPTVLSGINDDFEVLNLQGSNNTDLECLEITQPDTCTGAGGGAGHCTAGVNNFASHGIRFEYQTAQGPSNATLRDIAVVGMAGQGFLGSHINTLSTDVFTASDIYVIGNGSAGWDSDGGGCTTNCESVGTMNLSYVDVEWNGCVAVKPYNIGLPTSSNAFNYCYDDSTGGYGDGFAFIAAGNVTLNVSHSFFKYNTQDGFDSLHLSDDVTVSPSVNLTDSWSEGNEGQTFKLGAGTEATATNNVSISNCRVLATASNFPNNPAGWNAGVSDTCRASGDEWAFQMNNGTTITLENNTSVGYGTTMYDVGCASLAPDCMSNGAKFIFRNNINLGFPDPGNAGRLASGFFFGAADVFANAGSSIEHNLWSNMDSGCPDSAVPQETNSICADPLLTSESNINAIIPTLTSSSPAVKAGVVIPGLTLDYAGSPYTNPPNVGAY
jgi:hypothetical protein